ncbi:MAG TPA: S8 family serine peptidase [Solirubrobacteraceae bacterium]|jgi:thermitase|nr:S8 family serine peptidase [Solirubrobacteraceae bacterium]
MSSRTHHSSLAGRRLQLLATASCTALAALAAPPQASADGTVLAHLSKRAAKSRLAAAGVTSNVRLVAGTGARLLRVSGDPATAAARLRRTRGVLWAESNFRIHALADALPDDPQWSALYGVQRIGAPAFWAAHGLAAFPHTGGVPIGIVDTGIDAKHEDLAGRVSACGSASQGAVTAGDCSDDEGHGTHVAGTIGAIAGNGVGVAGVAFDAPLIVCRALGTDGSGTIADVAACMRWVHDKGAKVISMSLGGGPSQTLAAAAKSVYARGARAGSLIVAAAGNDGDSTVNYPAGLPQVVSVAAIGPDDEVAPFSNENADVEVAAAGVDVLSTKLGGGYVRLSGTSMATPHVSGAASLLWATAPTATATKVRAMLDAAVDDLGAPGRDSAYGFGVVDLSKAP